MSDQELQREAERYAEYQREQEAYEQAQYDDELSKAEQRIRELEAKLRVVNELKPLNKWDVEEALAEDDSLLFISYDELRVKLDELESLLKDGAL